MLDRKGEMAFLHLESHKQEVLQGLFEIAVFLKSPSVYEYRDEDLGEREWRKRRGRFKRGRERDQSGKEGRGERFCVSEVLSSPALWPLAGFTHWI